MFLQLFLYFYFEKKYMSNSYLDQTTRKVLTAKNKNLFFSFVFLAAKTTCSFLLTHSGRSCCFEYANIKVQLFRLTVRTKIYVRIQHCDIYSSSDYWITFSIFPYVVVALLDFIETEGSINALVGVKVCEIHHFLLISVFILEFQHLLLSVELRLKLLMVL